MGNRAVIQHLDENETPDTSIYLHWNGGADSVEAFLEYAKLQGVDGVNADYQMARLCQIIGNFMDGNYSLGIGPANHYGNPGDNGIYVINDELDIVDRQYEGLEQREHDMVEFVQYLDKCQPEHMRLGENFIEMYFDQKKHNRFTLKDISVGDRVAVRDTLRGGWQTYTILGFGDKDTRSNGYELEGLPFFNMTENYVETDSPFPVSKWTDEEALSEHKDNSNCYIKKDQEFIIVEKKKVSDNPDKYANPKREVLSENKNINNKSIRIDSQNRTYGR